ncbi:DUF11 domain-containing protein [Halioglobus maricola]|uniref:DUF11 domain-containing protein n=1 Tax=Halioglobus maricola TaxID=2601894 RepID=UPI0014797AA0|nr:DUF11 domain-containing protein [Halioglobus maricola]
MLYPHVQVGTRKAGLCAAVLAAVVSTAQAQSPAITVTGVPAEPLIGEEFCTIVSFTNAAAATGYGPYLVSTVDAGVSRISIDFVDIQPVLEPIGTFDASGVLVDPISGEIINGNEGGTALNALYPIGAVEQGTPPLDMEFCGVVDVGTEPNVPLDVEFIPGFEFGDTATGDNGAILGSQFDSTITPRLARVTKTNSAPENERPPGPSHAFNYRYTMDISDGVTLDDVLLEDILPPEIQWTGAAITINAPISVGCITASLPTFPPAPGGTLIVQCDAVTGSTSTEDLTVVVPVYITDILDETIDDSQLITNTVNAEYSYDGDDFNDTDDSNVVAVHAAAQKTVTGGNSPGDTLTYTINFQLTDYPDDVPGAGAESFIITDLLPDGLGYTTTLDLVINGANYPIAADVDYDPTTGTTLLTWDIAAAVDNLDPLLPNAVAGSLRYETEILTEYVNPAGPVQAGDRFTNNVTLGYGLTEGGSGGDGSDSESEIVQNDPTKALTTPAPGSFDTIMPGTAVVFTLGMEIPAGSSSDVVIKDFLPSPVFDVTQAPQPTINVLQGPLVSPVISGADNSVTLDYGDIVSDTPTTILVELTATVTTDPFADELFLTNLMQSAYTTTDGRVITEQDVAGITVGAPKLTLTKGVLSIANSNATLDPSPVESPVDSNGANADARDAVTYEITIENLGTQPAYRVTVLDRNVAGLNCQQNTIDVVNGDDQTLTYSGDLESGLILDDPLAASDNDPAEGGPPYGTDTAIINITCTLADDVYPRQVVTNTAAVTWTSTDDPADTPFTPATDDARVTIAEPTITKTVIASDPGYTGDIFQLHIGEIVTYRVEVTIPEGVSPNVRFEDLLDSGLVHLETTQIVFPDGVSSSLTDVELQANEGIIPANNDTSVEGVDRWKIFGPAKGQDGFGTVTNTNNSNATPDVITIEYRARVINSVLNVNSTSLRNRARWYWNPDDIDRQNVQAKADRVVVVEPDIRMTKTFSPEIGDNTTPPLVTIEFEHSDASTASAFDLTLFDLLPKDMGIVGNEAGVTVDGACDPPESITVLDAGLSEELVIEWDQFDIGDGTCTISFQTEFLIEQVPAGTQLNNCAPLFWESLSDNDPALQDPPNNTIAVERTGDTDDAGADANTYRSEACDTFQIYDVGIIKNVESSTQSHTDNTPGTPAGTEALTIGEIVVFDLVVTLPLAPTLELEVTDLLPRTEMVLELLDIEHISLGADLSPSIFPPDKSIIDSNGDGINDKGELDYGSVGHIIEPPVIDDDDRILVRVTAKVLDVPQNANERVDSNSAVVEFLPDTAASDTYPLELVEPILQLEKIGSTNTVEAGDSVDFRLVVSHANGSRTDAQNLELVDALPPQFELVGGSVVVGDVCSVQPDAPPDVSGQTISASWTEFPLGAYCEIDFSVTVSLGAVSGQTITNEGDISWTTLNRSEQTDLDDEREYMLSDAWTVVVSVPGLNKTITDTSNPDTPFTLEIPLHRLTIGEEATFTLVTSFPDGTTLDTRISDLLPTNDVALEFVSSRIVSVGSDLFVSGASTIGEPGTDCSPPADECLNWILGTVINQPDLRDEPDEADQFVVELVAIVLDDPLNSGAPGEDKNLLNTANTVTSEVTLTDAAQFDIVEPQLRLQKLTSNGGIEKTTAAGIEEEFTLIIQHRATSTANARTIQILDTLHPEMEWVDDATVTSTCAGLVIQSAPLPGTSGNVAFVLDRLTLVQDQCEIKYTVMMSDELPIQGVFRNEALLSWESSPGSPESRFYSDLATAVLISLEDADISKRVFATSVPDSESGQGDPDITDVLIGEHIEYTLSLRFAEGTTPDVVLTDTFQLDGAGELEYLGGDLFFIGDNITATPQDPVLSGDTITIDIGDVINTPDRDTNLNDTVVIRLQLRAPDVPANSAGDILLNETELSYSGVGGITLTQESEAEVEIIEPILTHVKTFTSLVNAVATIQLEIGNTGTGPAYDLVITDEFDEAIWVPGSLLEISAPEGMAITESSSGGVTTVTIQAETPTTPPPPNQVLSPGESATVIFSMTLQNDGYPGPTRIPNTAELEGSSLPGDDDAERIYIEDASDELLLPALDLLKAWAGPTNPAVPGDTLTYTLTLQNTGDAPATDIVITDTPDANGSFQVGSVVAPGGTIVSGNTSGDTAIEVTFPSVDAGAEVTVSYSVLVPLPYPAGLIAEEQLVNQALATSEELPDILSDDPATPDVDDETIVPLVADPVMTVSKTDGTDRASPGDTLTYTVTYGNTGDQNATGVLLTEIVPLYTSFDAGLSDPNWVCDDVVGGSTCELDIDTLPGGGAGSALFVVTIDNTVPPGVFEIINDVMVEEDGLEFGNVPSPPSVDTDQDIDYLSAQPNLVIAKNDGGISVIPGQGYRYGIVYGNVGDQGASGVVLSEVVPDYTVFSSSLSTPGWICDASTPGSVCTFDVGILDARSGSQADFGLITDFPAAAGVDLINNTAVLADDGSSQVGPLEVDSSDITPVIANPDMEITKTTESPPPREGDVIVYDITYRQVGNQDATGVVIREIVPPGTEYLASASDAWSCPDGSAGGTLCAIAVGNLAAGAGGTATFAVTMVTESKAGKIVNVIETNDDGTNGSDPTPGNNIDVLIIEFFDGRGIPVMPRLFLASLLLGLLAVAGSYLSRRRQAH